MKRAELEAEVERRHWFHTFQIAEGLWTKGHYKPNPPWVFGLMELPEDMSGMRALDLGCADGLYGFEMARRGAEVTAVDLFSEKFRNVNFLSELWNIPINYVQSTVYTFHDDPFDLVLALGVLYHLQYPLLGLHRMNELCAGALVLETQIRRGWSRTFQFLPGDELNEDPSNWWVPTRKCLAAMVRSAGFEVEKSLSHAPRRFMLKARKVREVTAAFSHDEVHQASYGFAPY